MMLLYPQSKDRPFHLGLFPLESLPRDERVIGVEASRAAILTAPSTIQLSNDALSRACDHYREIFSKFALAVPATARAPVPDDLDRRSTDVKGAAYFMDASFVGICRIPQSAWIVGSERLPHDTAIVVMVEHPRRVEPDNLAHEWTDKAVTATADMRACEIGCCLAEYIRHMGFDARAHFAGHQLLDMERLAVLSGLAVRSGASIENPYIGKNVSLAVVSTDYELASDMPLRADALGANGLAYWWGINGARSGRERNRRARRKTHLSSYPMETVKRIDRPTTLIIDKEVPRVPKRAAFFQRALHGDLGEKARKERGRFAFKTPLSFALLQLIRSLVKYQDGEVSPAEAGALNDPAAKARAIKSLSYFLGSDLTGICEIPRYAWFSHKEDGSTLEPYHRYAVVMLIDQGYDTMEGASGDDWISGMQSMRGYLRGAEIAGVMGEFLRAKGFPARARQRRASHPVDPVGRSRRTESDRRTGVESVCRAALQVGSADHGYSAGDRQADRFRIADICSNCLKCARECPCDAIPFGDKIMFNGYEIWKPDVERCTRYRVTNPKGSACGRCMKTCLINKVVDTDGALLTRVASWPGVNAMWLKPLTVPIATLMDDWLENGKRNAAKKWWLDHELINGVAVAPKGTNQRDIEPGRKVDPANQKMAVYPASMMPPPNEPGPVEVNRKATMAAVELLETPAQARKRVAASGAPPSHYAATPPLDLTVQRRATASNPYK